MTVINIRCSLLINMHFLMTPSAYNETANQYFYLVYKAPNVVKISIFYE